MIVVHELRYCFSQMPLSYRHNAIQALALDREQKPFGERLQVGTAGREAMIAQGLVPHSALIERSRAAVESYEMDARADKLPTYIARLHQIERDQFGLPPTNIEALEYPLRQRGKQTRDTRGDRLGAAGSRAQMRAGVRR
jgi:hypothetical protein